MEKYLLSPLLLILEVWDLKTTYQKTWLAYFGGIGLDALPLLQGEMGFYPTALKGCRGIVFTHVVQMGEWAFGQAHGRWEI